MAKKRTVTDAGVSQGANEPTAKRQQPEQPDVYKSRLSDDTLRSAVNALLKDCEKYEKKRARKAAARGKTIGELTKNDICVYLCVTLKVPPHKTKLRPVAIPIRHSLYSEDEDEVCFFVKDPQRLVKDYFEEHGNGGVTRVMGVDKLRKRYGTHESRRELLQMYDLFLVDNRVAPMMSRLLGNAFLRAHKMPLSVDMEKDLVPAVKRTISSTAFYTRQGTSSTLRVAKTEFSPDQVVENITDAIDGVVKRLSNGWDDIQSLNIKTNSSVALPIFITLPTPVEPHVKSGQKKKKKNSEKKDVVEKGVSAKFQGVSRGRKTRQNGEPVAKEVARVVVEEDDSSSGDEE